MHNRFGDRGPFNQNGGLTLVPMPGFEQLAVDLKTAIEGKGKKEDGDETPIDIAVPSFGLYVNGEPDIRLGKDHVGGHDCVILTSGPGTYQMTGQLIYLVGYLAGRKARRITIVSGYFPLGRTDKDEGDEVFALPRLLYDCIRAVDQGLLSRIVCADPHCDQIVMSGQLGRVTPIYLTRRLLTHLIKEARTVSERFCIAFPDDSARRRFKTAVRDVEKELGHRLPRVTASQDRLSSDDKELQFINGDLLALRDAIVISVDDETAKGTTQINAARGFKTEYGAREVWGAVTHGVLCANAPEQFALSDCPIDRLYITDTIPVTDRSALRPLLASGRLRVLSWFDDLTWIIYHHHWDKKIRGIR
ncbi:MAG TPA: hypothetical protein VJA22_02430 [Patescibacteria group bacterium]|nr:hypothetical protein [Patescibacteria group bacterium]